MNFTLRQWKISDASSLAKYANNQNIAKFLRDAFPYPYTLADAEWFINDCISNSNDNRLVYAIDVDGQAVGGISILPKDDVYCKSAELGYWLAEEFWNGGIMTAAIGQICNEAFKSFDIVRVFAEPFADNIGSRRVLEKNGFTLEGIMKNGVFKNSTLHDYCMYALLKQ